MLDAFAHPDVRKRFLAETTEMQGSADGEDEVASMRTLLCEEPVAILYCMTGSYVKVSPADIKTSNGCDDKAASLQMCETLRKSFKDHLSSVKPDKYKLKDFGAAQVLTSTVTSEVGVRWGHVWVPLSLPCYTCFA